MIRVDVCVIVDSSSPFDDVAFGGERKNGSLLVI